MVKQRTFSGYTKDQVDEASRLFASDIGQFSEKIIGLPLRAYQLEPLRAIARSVLDREGEEFLLVFPRQSGKNEAVAQLLVYLFNLLQGKGGNMVFAAIGDGLGRGIERLEQRLDNKLNQGIWRKKGRPQRRTLGQAAVTFISSHPSAHARGETAHWLLALDELQDQDAAHVAAVFSPMRAAYNATALYLGTVRLTSDALWQKKVELERKSEQDGRRRVYLVTPAQVAADNPHYGRLLAQQEKLYGRNHPIIASEYYLEPIDATGRLFDPRRLALMRGSHARIQNPKSKISSSPPSTWLAKTKPPPIPSPPSPTPVATTPSLPFLRSSSLQGIRRQGDKETRR